jgi:hypothetical protein
MKIIEWISGPPTRKDPQLYQVEKEQEAIVKRLNLLRTLEAQALVRARRKERATHDRV